jgi:hypothetical protein
MFDVVLLLSSLLVLVKKEVDALIAYACVYVCSVSFFVVVVGICIGIGSAITIIVHLAVVLGFAVIIEVYRHSSEVRYP